MLPSTFEVSKNKTHLRTSALQTWLILQMDEKGMNERAFRWVHIPASSLQPGVNRKWEEPAHATVLKDGYREVCCLTDEDAWID